MNPDTGKLGMSYSKFKSKDLSKLGHLILQVSSILKLIWDLRVIVLTLFISCGCKYCDTRFCYSISLKLAALCWYLIYLVNDFVISKPKHSLSRMWQYKLLNEMIFLCSAIVSFNIKKMLPSQVAELLKLLEVRRGQEDDDEFIECNNMTIINLVLKFLGPTHERNLTTIMLLIQVKPKQPKEPPTCTLEKTWMLSLFRCRWWEVRWRLGSVTTWCASSMMSRGWQSNSCFWNNFTGSLFVPFQIFYYLIYFWSSASMCGKDSVSGWLQLARICSHHTLHRNIT